MFNISIEQTLTSIVRQHCFTTGQGRQKSTNNKSINNAITLETKQQTTFLSVGNTAKDNYMRLIRTALHIAIKEKPFSDFPDLIKLQQSNSLKFVTGKTHRKACAQFIEILANIIRVDIKNILHFSMDPNLKNFLGKRTFVPQSCYQSRG